jgi:hypothetical protein
MEKNWRSLIRPLEKGAESYYGDRRGWPGDTGFLEVFGECTLVLSSAPCNGWMDYMVVTIE